MVNWSTHTQNTGTLPFNCNTTFDKEKARKAFIDEGKGVRVRRVLMMSKMRKARSNDG